MSIYEEKKQAKIERYKKYSKNAQEKSDKLYSEAKDMASVIPFGQPILVGHHSEKKDRRYRNKIENRFEKSFEEERKSEYWKDRAASIANNAQIQSDDPEAIKKLENRIKELVKFDENAKRLNNRLRKFKTYKNALEFLKLLDDKESKMLYKHISESVSLYNCPPEYISCYYYKYNSPEIRRLRKRLAYLEKEERREAISFEIKNISVVEEDGQIRVYFPDKPDAEIRRKLKTYPLSLKWSRYSNAWVRKKTESTGKYFIKCLKEVLTSIT